MPVAGSMITLQTFGICITLLLLGGKYGCISISAYLLLGAAGLPVFAGFRGGMGVLLGPTGGYIWGFGISALIYWLFTAVSKNKSPVRLIGLLVGLLLCYLSGSLWYMHTYLNGQTAAFGAAVLKCVVPYILPDALKLTLAYTLSHKLKAHIKL